MAEFLKSSQINLVLEEMIRDAERVLIFISPYIKLHDRLKDELKRKKENEELVIKIVYGKNEYDPSKSLSLDDIEFLKDFPNIKIYYNKNLHAKFYASEDISLITSMNLHVYSQNTNVEAAVLTRPRTGLNRLTDIVAGDSLDQQAWDYFREVIENSELQFEKNPVYEKSMLGLVKKYSHSEIAIDNLPLPAASFSPLAGETSQAPLTSKKEMGYCIRTGKPIPFNPAKPMCKEAYDLWAHWKRMDYPEAFCHKTGKPSHGKTSMRNPILV